MFSNFDGYPQYEQVNEFYQISNFRNFEEEKSEKFTFGSEPMLNLKEIKESPRFNFNFEEPKQELKKTNIKLEEEPQFTEINFSGCTFGDNCTFNLK